VTRVYTSQLTGQLFRALFVPHSPSPSHMAPIATVLQFARYSRTLYAGQVPTRGATQHGVLDMTLWSVWKGFDTTILRTIAL